MGTSWPFPPGFRWPITTHVCIYWVPVQGGLGVGGRAHCKGTGSSLFGAGSPACCQQALWPAPTPPFWPQAQAGFLHWCLASSRQQLRCCRNRFPQFDSSGWVGPAGLFLTRISTWLLSIEIPSPGASRWAWGISTDVHTHMNKHTFSNSDKNDSLQLSVCMSHACLQGMHIGACIPTISTA